MQRIERGGGEDDEGNCREKEMEIEREREREKKARQRETGNPLTPPSEFLPGSRSRSCCVTARERQERRMGERAGETEKQALPLSFSIS